MKINIHIIYYLGSHLIKFGVSGYLIYQKVD